MNKIIRHLAKYLINIQILWIAKLNLIRKENLEKIEVQVEKVLKMIFNSQSKCNQRKVLNNKVYIKMKTKARIKVQS